MDHGFIYQGIQLINGSFFFVTNGVSYPVDLSRRKVREIPECECALLSYGFRAATLGGRDVHLAFSTTAIVPFSAVVSCIYSVFAE